MAESRNNRSPSDLFKGFDTTLRHYLVDRPRAYIHVLKSRFEHLPETNFKLGCQFAEQGKWVDAMFRFRLAIYLKPNFAAAHYNLGCCYLQQHKYPQARSAFRTALKFKPNYPEAVFMLSGLEPNAVPPDALPKRMPAEMVSGFFTQIAADYDAICVQNDYQGPRIAAEALKPFLKHTQDLRLLDLGCGTGLAARPWRTLCKEVTGIDLTQAMVNTAHASRVGDNPVFERVLHFDILALPADAIAAASQDVVLCIDTAQFLGDLAPMLQVAAKALAPGGVMALSIEPFNAPHGFGVNPETGRFGHTPDYVKAAATAAGLEVKKDGRVALYPELAGYLFVITKPGGAA